MKRVFLLLFLCTISIASAQGLPQFTANAEVVAPLFPNKSNPLSVQTVSMLAKVDVIQASVSLPSEYNWSRSLRQRAAIRYFALEHRPQDANGRDIQIPMIEKLTTELYYKNLPSNFNANCHN